MNSKAETIELAHASVKSHLRFTTGWNEFGGAISTSTLTESIVSMAATWILMRRKCNWKSLSGKEAYPKEHYWGKCLQILPAELLSRGQLSKGLKGVRTWSYRDAMTLARGRVWRLFICDCYIK